MGHESSVQERITSFWSAIAEGYEAHAGNVEAFGTPGYQEWVRVVGEALPSSSADVLDVGAGTGFASLIAAGLGHRVTGIDLAEPMLAEARANARRLGLGATFRTGDAVSPDFPAVSFDVVMSRHVYWTLRDPDAAFANWRRLLRDRGRIIIIDGFWFDDADDAGAGEPTSSTNTTTAQCESNFPDGSSRVWSQLSGCCGRPGSTTFPSSSSKVCASMATRPSS